MSEIKKYVEAITLKAKGYLKNEYHLDSFEFSDFQSVNFFLIDKALNESKSLHIQSFDKNLPSLSHFPTILSVAISLFFKNFCDDKTTYEIGDVLQSEGLRYRIIDRIINNERERTHQSSKIKNGFVLFSLKDNTTKEIKSEKIKEFIVTNADLSNRKTKTKFDDYRALCKLVYGEDYVPSKFKYKSAIIIEKKEFDEELRSQNYTDIDILKAIPMRWISKNGTESWNHIPIEPMIYCVPDFETLEEHILLKEQQIEALVIIGNNKYRGKSLSKIKRSLREGTIPTCIVLGSEPILDNNSQFNKWKWTYDEYSIMEGKKSSEIHSIKIESEFYAKIEELMTYLNSLEETHSINLKPAKSLRKFLFPLALSQETNSRNKNQVEYASHLLTKVVSESIIENLYNQNIDSSEYLAQATKLITCIFESFSNDKLKKLKEILNYDILIVPESLLANWKD